MLQAEISMTVPLSNRVFWASPSYVWSS